MKKEEMMNHYVLLMIGMLIGLQLEAQAPRLVKDITPGTASTFSNTFDPDDEGIMLSFQDKVLLVVKDGGQRTLWVSNGEEEDTYPLHELEVGASFVDFVEQDEETIFYSIENDVGGAVYALSKETLDTSQLYSNNSGISLLTYLNGQLFFKEEDKLMKLDPNEEGAALIYEFSALRSIRDIGVLNDGLIIIGGESNGTELYYSDGTTDGTSPYFLLNDGSDFSGDYYMTAADDQLFFFYNRPSEPYKLYVTDGTSEGTMSLIDLERITFTDLEHKRAIIVWDGKLFFRGRSDGSEQDALFVSDGTIDGTFKITINSGTLLKPEYFTPYNGSLFFKAESSSFVFTVYKTDGTPMGTEEAFETSELGGGLSFGGSFLRVHDGLLYFYGTRSEVGEELWYSEGTTNTTQVIDIIPGGGSSVPTQMTSTDNFLFFMYKSPEYGKELFVLDEEVAVQEQASVPDLSIYPNPFSNYLSIDTDSRTEVEGLTLEISNTVGKRVFRGKLTGEAIALPGLPGGSYIAVVRQEGAVVFRQMLIKR